MSSCFNSDWQSRKLALVTALLAMLACGSAAAQSVSDNLPFESSASGRVYNGTTPLRLWHQTRGYGMEASQTAFGGRYAVDLVDAVGFLDGQFRVSNESQFGIDFGGGFRWMDESFITGATRVYGLTGWYDGQETNLNNYFNQLGVSLESLGQYVDFRMNANIPLENVKSGDTIIETDAVTYTGSFLTLGTIVPSDVALRVVDFEVAPRIFDLNAWVYGGGYQMDGDGVSDFGAKGGVRGYVTNDLAVDVGVQDDDVFGTNTVFQVIWTPGRTGAGPTSWVHTLADRMREQVYRNTYVATDQFNQTGSINLTDVDGDDIRVVHVDFTSTAPGDGSFENPYTTIDSASGAGSQQGDIILVHAQNGANVYNGQSIVLKDEQRFLGEGGGIEHEVVTQQRGTVVLPETFAGALNATRPTMQNSPGAAVTLAGATLESENFTPMEVSNFVITGGANAVISDTNGVAAVNINNLNVNNTTGDGIALAAMTQTLENGTTRSRFGVTIDEITFDNVGDADADDDIQLDAGTTQTTIVHSTAISNIVSTNGDGVGINLIENQRAVTINNFDWNGGTTGLGALLITEAGTQGGVTLSNSDAGDDNLFTGGTVGAANAIRIENSAATHTVTGTLVTNMGGDSIVVNDGAANLNFTGKITQTANAESILSVTAGHTGSLTFTELTANNGVINATTGDGLQFNDADGVYTFNDEAVFTGVSQAINVVESDAVITMLDVQITNTTDTAITFNGGDSNLAFTGHVTQTTAQNVLEVTNEHTGTLVFNEVDAGAGLINSTGGGGLVFNDADGAYTFNDEVILSGPSGLNSAISVTADSEGTFTFSDADIDYTGTGSAVTIAGSDVQAFTLSGAIDLTGAGTGRPVSITDNTGGSITFNSTITSAQGGILVTDNTDTTIRFAGQTTLNTGANTGVSLEDNTNGGIRFDALDITTSTGDAFAATNTDNLTVQGTGNTITVTAGAAGTVGLELNDVEVGSAGVAFQSVTTTGGDNGIVLNNVRGGAVTIGAAGAAAGTGGTILNSINEGVLITNAANVTLNGLAITGAGGAGGISASQTTTTASSLTVNNTNITNPDGDAVNLSNMSNVALNTMIITGNGVTGDGINIDHNNGSQSVVRITTVDVTNAGGIGIDFNRTATALSRLTLTDVDISDSGAEGIALDVAGSSTVDITIQADSSVSNNAGGSAIALNTTGGSKTVNFLVDSGDFNNDNADATIAIVANSAGSLNTTVTSNNVNNTGTGRAYSQEVVAGTTRLNFNGNTLVNAAVTDEVLLTETAGNFIVVDLPTIETRNGGAQVEQVGTITNDPGGTVPTPTP